MAQYTLEQLEQLVRLKGEGTSHVTSHDYVPVQDRIYAAVKQQGGSMSRAQIAKAIGRVKAGWIDRHIEQLVYDGYLTRHETIRPNGMLMYFYEVKR